MPWPGSLAPSPSARCGFRWQRPTCAATGSGRPGLACGSRSRRRPWASSRHHGMWAWPSPSCRRSMTPGIRTGCAGRRPRSRRLWIGEVVAEPMAAHERPDDVAWFELAAVDGPAARVVFAPPPAILVGSAAPPWPTPAGAALPGQPAGSGAGSAAAAAGGRGGGSRGPRVSRRDTSAKPSLAADPGQARALIAPGPAAYVAASCPSGHTARSPDRPVRCPAVRTRSCGDRGLVGWPRHPAAHLRLALGPGPDWPAVIPSFRSAQSMISAKSTKARRATGAGTVPARHGESPLWPAVPRRAGRLRVVISTLWEARRADVELPSR